MSDLSQKAQDIVDLINGAPGPYLENETSFFGQKRVNPSMKDARMETDCGGALITKGKMTYGAADALAASVDLSDFPLFADSVTGPECYHHAEPDGRFFFGVVYWVIYSYLTTRKIIEGDPKSYHNGMEYLYDEVLKRLVTDGIYTADPEWRWFTRSAS